MSIQTAIRPARSVVRCSICASIHLRHVGSSTRPQRRSLHSSAARPDSSISEPSSSPSSGSSSSLPGFIARREQKIPQNVNVTATGPSSPQFKTQGAGYAGAQGSMSLSKSSFLPPPPPSPLQIVQKLLTRLPEFSNSKRFRTRVSEYGLLPDEAKKTISNWVNEVEGQLGDCKSDQEAMVACVQHGWILDHLTKSFETPEREQSFASALESAMTRHYATFASRDPSIDQARQRHLKVMLDLTDLSDLPFTWSFQSARALKRKFHLHIGPTNSGKTYNALKALSKAKTGAYAGPLRLLAHEVWERLNMGTVGDLDGKQKHCNLLTGEENRIVDAEAGLLSCTVEMLPMNGHHGEPHDVVVIDEIQMLADSARGGAWSKAVIGVRAKEIHLCGDETTLELLSSFIPSLGDTLEVHRYERLTPLSVGNESLKGDFNNVQTGDCVVTFSRSNIFAVKKAIEQATSKKCAVVYGALPPETRAEQARNFNDEESMEEILVASDAVGMGLNLKIKRLVFESLTKYNGRNEVPLSITQVKQIAGRAGRYGMQTTKADTSGDEGALDDIYEKVKPDDAAEYGGIVTTLHEEDLPILREVLPLPLAPVRRMMIDVPIEVLKQMATLLPPTTSYFALLEHINALTLLPPGTCVTDINGILPQTEIVEFHRKNLSLYEMDVFTKAPIGLRDPVAKQVFAAIVNAYAKQGLVDLQEIFAQSRLLKMLDLVEGTLAVLPPLPPIIGIGRRVLTPPVIVASVPSLETLHKCLVVYLWLSFRLPIAFPDRSQVAQLKDRCETVLEECIERLPGMRNKKTHERSKEGDRAVADWRKKYVAPNGTRRFAGSDKKGVLWVDSAIAQRLRNKAVWQSTGVVPQERWLNEIDGKGQGQAPPPPKIPGGFRGNFLVNPPRKAIEGEVEGGSSGSGEYDPAFDDKWNRIRPYGSVKEHFKSI